MIKRSNSNTWEVLHRLKKNKLAVIGMIIFVVEIVLAIIAPLIIPYSPTEMDYMNLQTGPCVAHWFGTDELGRDIFSRLLYGSRYSLGLSVSSMLIALVLGVIFGSCAGFFGGMVDNIIMRVLDVFQAMPGLLMGVAISAALGTGFFNTALALSIGWIPTMTRMLRGSILKVREMEFLEAAESINCSKLRTIVTHVLPNSVSPLIVTATLCMANVIMGAAALSFIGLGIQPPTPEWGAMLSSARAFFRDYPYMIIIPGIAIAITVLSLNVMGDGLRDAMDPKLKD